MELDEKFAFVPLPPIRTPIHIPVPWLPSPLGPLSELPGTWKGTGFNTIWRPLHDPAHPAQDRFLELNRTDETIEFVAIPGQIPNRGLLQNDINMFGVRYLQQISDANLSTPANAVGLHIEPGIWAVVPQTTNPLEPPTVVRMGSIPHGTTILAQGVSLPELNGPPPISNNNITPFQIDSPNNTVSFPESNLGVPTPFRSSGPQMAGITQAMVDNPNSVLQNALQGQTIKQTLTLMVSTDSCSPVLGGGTANTAFLQGAKSAGPNADAAVATAIFWIEWVTAPQPFLQLQYTQTVLLNFNGLSWPHVTVATLVKQASHPADVKTVDPTISAALLARAEPTVKAPAKTEVPAKKT